MGQNAVSALETKMFSVKQLYTPLDVNVQKLIKLMSIQNAEGRAATDRVAQATARIRHRELQVQTGPETSQKQSLGKGT